jgi:3-hydroxybutyryl-CoA dehydrogenase
MIAASIESVTIVGAGFMGWQIALQAARHGMPVTMTDLSADALARAHAQQRAQLDAWVTAGELTVAEAGAALERIRTAAEPAPAGLVIEAVPERLELKREVFARLDALFPPPSLLATNSSSFRIAQIEDAASRRDRVLNMHFFSVVWQRPMVELMGGAETSEATLATAAGWVRRVGLVPLRVRKQSTGFLFNRVWRAIKKEALTVADTGVASVEDIDRAWMIFMKHDMGPFGLMDHIGLDVIADIERVYQRESGDPKDAPPRLLLDLVERGHLGVKTGRGFYTYPDPPFARPDFLRGE